MLKNVFRTIEGWEEFKQHVEKCLSPITSSWVNMSNGFTEAKLSDGRVINVFWSNSKKDKSFKKFDVYIKEYQIFDIWDYEYWKFQNFIQLGSLLHLSPSNNNNFNAFNNMLLENDYATKEGMFIFPTDKCREYFTQLKSEYNIKNKEYRDKILGV
jgi:hypothetical protein